MACGTPSWLAVRNIAVPGTRTGGCSVMLLMKGAIGMAPGRSRSNRISRPRFHVDSSTNTTMPTTTGNQPPSGILTMLAEKKDTSISRNAAEMGIAAHGIKRGRIDVGEADHLLARLDELLKKPIADSEDDVRSSAVDVQEVATVYRLNAGDDVRMKVQQNASSGTVTLIASSGGAETSPELSMTLLGPA